MPGVFCQFISPAYNHPVQKAIREVKCTVELESAGRAGSICRPFRLVRLREAGDAFAHAQAIAGAAGAGTLVQVGRFDLAELAVVLEPEVPLRAARCGLYAGLVALRAALVAQVVTRPLGKRERRTLTTALAESSWLDLETGGPRR